MITTWTNKRNSFGIEILSDSELIVEYLSTGYYDTGSLMGYLLAPEGYNDKTLSRIYLKDDSGIEYELPLVAQQEIWNEMEDWDNV